jgi:hypothetical protein
MELLWIFVIFLVVLCVVVIGEYRRTKAVELIANKMGFEFQRNGTIPVLAWSLKGLSRDNPWNYDVTEPVRNRRITHLIKKDQEGFNTYIFRLRI